MATRSIYQEAYADEPFVELSDAPPGVRDVRETKSAGSPSTATIAPAG